MKILVVSSYLPFPLHSGGDVRLFNILKRLSKNHELTLVCEKRPHQTKEDVSEIEKICQKVYTVDRKKQWSIRNIVSSILSTKNSFLTNGHLLPDMKFIINELITDQKFDLIHVETFYVLQNVPVTDIPITLSEHNIEHKVYEKYKNSTNLFLKPLFNFDIKKMRKEEIKAWKKVKKVITVSVKDQDIIEKESGIVSSIIPNGVDIEYFTKKKKITYAIDDEKKILFIGNYKWIQNTTSLDYILNKLWPEIEEKTPQNVKLWIVGRDLPSEYKKYESKRIIIEGLSERPAPEIFSESFLLLSPLFVSGGTQYKILESMASGTPVVTTPLGIDGLKEEVKKSILIGDNKKELIESVIKIINNEKEYQKLSNLSRKFIEDNYSFDMISENLDNLYKKIKSE